jgi:hypothetical protein
MACLSAMFSASVVSEFERAFNATRVPGDLSADRIAAANEVEEQVHVLDDSQVSLAFAFVQQKAARTKQEIGNVLTDKKSFTLEGIPESAVTCSFQVLDTCTYLLLLSGGGVR